MYDVCIPKATPFGKFCNCASTVIGSMLYMFMFSAVLINGALFDRTNEDGGSDGVNRNSLLNSTCMKTSGTINTTEIPRGIMTRLS